MGTLKWTDGNGKEVSRETKYTVDIRDFKGTAGYPWLVIAANRHLSVDVLAMWLRMEGNNYERSRSWIARHRWLFEDSDTANKPGRKPNADGKDARAIVIMRENPKLSARSLSRLLGQCGIKRDKDWVLRHRCD